MLQSTAVNAFNDIDTLHTGRLGRSKNLQTKAQVLYKNQKSKALAKDYWFFSIYKDRRL